MESKQIEWRQNTYMQMFEKELQYVRKRREADKMFHSASCTLQNLFFTACYPP